MTVFAADDFNRSNRNLLGDTASDGGTWEQWEAGDTTDIKIVSNQATTGDSGTHYLLHSGVADDDDITVSCTCDPTGDKARFGHVAHAGLSGTNQRQGYVAWRDTSVERWQMYRFNGDGTSTRIYNSAPGAFGDVAPALLEFDATVGALVLKFDGSPVTSTIADSTYVGGKAGMAWNGGSGATSGQVPAYFDDWQAETPVAGGGTTPVNNDTSLAWSVRALIGSASTHTWTVLKNVANESAHLWNLLNLAQSDTVLRWSTLQQVSQTNTAVWALLQQAQADSAQRWDVRELIAGDQTLLWSLTKVIGQTATLEWNLDSATGTVGNALTAQWSLVQAIAAQLEIDWSMLQSVGVDQTAMWGVLEGVVQAIEAQWAVRNGVAQAVALSWNDIGVVGGVITMRWDVSAGGVSSPVLAIVIPAEARTIIIPDDGREIIIQADQPLH